MLKKIFTIIFLCISFTLKAQNPAVRITVTGIPKVKGQLLVAFYNSEKKFLDKDEAAYSKIIPVTGKSMDVYFKDVLAGDYAVAVIHDANNNNELDVNFLGIPVEYIGTSNNKRNYFGPPSYNDSRLLINNILVHFTITLY